MNPTPEKAVKEALKTYLKSVGAYYFMPVQMGYGSACIDFLVCHKGRFYGIETKRPAVDEPTSRQDAIMKQIEDAGGVTWLENSLDLKVTRAFLSR